MGSLSNWVAFARTRIGRLFGDDRASFELGPKDAEFLDELSRRPDEAIIDCWPYTPVSTYALDDVVHHPQFGVGFVVELLDSSMILVLFRSGARILIHTRAELAGELELPVFIVDRTHHRRASTATHRTAIEIERLLEAAAATAEARRGTENP